MAGRQHAGPLFGSLGLGLPSAVCGAEGSPAEVRPAAQPCQAAREEQAQLAAGRSRAAVTSAAVVPPPSSLPCDGCPSLQAGSTAGEEQWAAMVQGGTAGDLQPMSACLPGNTSTCGGWAVLNPEGCVWAGSCWWSTEPLWAEAGGGGWR